MTFPCKFYSLNPVWSSSNLSEGTKIYIFFLISRLSEIWSRWLGLGSFKDDAMFPTSLYSYYLLTIKDSSKTIVLLISSSYFNFKIYFSAICFSIWKNFKFIHLINIHSLWPKLGTKNIMMQTTEFLPTNCWKVREI